MRKRTCKQCGTKYQVRDKRRKFCSLECCWQWRREHKGAPGQFRPGEQSWNTGTKGLTGSNSGSFQPGRQCATKRDIGDVTIRIDKCGRRRAWIKVTDKGHVSDWKQLATVVWERKHGRLRKGSFIHHKDRDTLNNRLSNLQKVTRAEHLDLHRHEHKRMKRNARTT